MTISYDKFMKHESTARAYFNILGSKGTIEDAVTALEAMQSYSLGIIESSDELSGDVLRAAEYDVNATREYFDKLEALGEGTLSKIDSTKLSNMRQNHQKIDAWVPESLKQESGQLFAHG